MKREDLFKNYPTKRIKPTDGMEITADVWDAAHGYHSMVSRYHDLLADGAGILGGLDVVASDPPDTTVYIMPGVAVDLEGNQVVVPTPVTFDVGNNNDGLLYLLLQHGESRPRLDRSGGNVYYVHSEFNIVATPVLPDRPFIELARIERSTRTATVRMPLVADHPASDELDLRFRQQIGIAQPPVVRIAMAGVGPVNNEAYVKGLGALARVMRQHGQPTWVDLFVSLDAETLNGYTMVYLLNQEAGQSLPDDAVKALTEFVKKGGTVVLEGVRPDKEKDTAPGDELFTKLGETLVKKLVAVERGHGLLSTPHLFAGVPDGFDAAGKGSLMVGEGVIVSKLGYAALWQGDRRGGVASREQLRTAEEFGHNLVAYAVARRTPAR